MNTPAGYEIKTLKQFVVFMGAKQLSLSTEGPGMRTALGKFWKLGPSQRFDTDFLALEKGCNSENQ